VTWRTATHLGAALLALIALAMVVIVGLYAYLAIGGRIALTDTLMAHRAGTPIPANVLFDTSHFSVHMKAAGRLPKLLKAGFSVGKPMFMWEAPRNLGASYSIDAKEDIQLVCEVYRRKKWLIFCGQLRCANDDPCWFENTEGTRYLLVSERPNNKLQRTRGGSFGEQ
jgi:hypothetical protein